MKIDLRATSKNTSSLTDPAKFSAVYEARFSYLINVTKETISPLFEQEPYQYTLAAQAFPLAITHFRRELQFIRFDARSLPLGL